MELFTEELLRHYDHFVIPFTVGVAVLFSVVLYKYIRWFIKMPHEDKVLVGKNIFTFKTVRAAGEVVSESLLHRKIFKVNPMLGYMHMSLAFGWFLLIVIGWIEASMHLKGEIIPLHAHVFYKYFATGTEAGTAARALTNIMDILLLLVLSGVSLAWYKRWRSRSMGMKRTTKHTRGDKIALSALWMIFPVRLLAESASSGLKGIDSFLTGNIGAFMVDTFGTAFVSTFAIVMWWFYSINLGVFFVAMPFSRYMHIFTEVPLIFLRRYGVKSGEQVKTFDHFQIEACSRCGVCIDPCQLQKDAGYKDVQSVYFVRDRRYHKLSEDVTFNCLMCGRCEAKCPVGIELNTLRLNSREKFAEVPADNRYGYIDDLDSTTGTGRTAYFAGCMTLLSPRILRSMEKIFETAGEDVLWADREGGVCCGRPLKLSGEVAAAQKMVEYNRSLFSSKGISTLVTSCPICLKVFRDDYELDGIEVLHHTEYILRLMQHGKITPVRGQELYTYHDPCELGRGCGIYDEPREIIRKIGNFTDIKESGRDGLCCGSSLANLEISDASQMKMNLAVVEKLRETGAGTIVTSCPQCKKSLVRNFPATRDIAEIVAQSISN